MFLIEHFIRKIALPQLEWVDYRCRVEFIRPTAIGDKAVAMSYDSLRRGRHSLLQQGDVISLARVVMPDHLHWLIQLNDRWSLSTVAKTLKARSARSINRHLCQQGSLWQRACYDRAARKDEDVRQIARYIVANPLRAGLVRNIGDYPHWDCIWMTDDDETPLVD
jgi:REP element-mobilizing transposase RayT